MKIAVGSKNPAKLKSVELAFQAVWPGEQFELIGLEVGSGVSAQPMSHEESIQGARNRAQKAIKEVDADYGVGLEGGLSEINGMWFDSGWMVVVDRHGNEGIGSSIHMQTPEKMLKMVREGKELGEIDDSIFGLTNSKHNQGHFGLMTNNAVTRTEGYKQGIIAALARFIRPEVFVEE